MRAITHVNPIAGFPYRGESPTSSRLSSLTPEPQDDSHAGRSVPARVTTRKRRRMEREENLEGLETASRVEKETAGAPSRSRIISGEPSAQQLPRARTRKAPMRYIEEGESQSHRAQKTTRRLGRRNSLAQRLVKGKTRTEQGRKASKKRKTSENVITPTKCGMAKDAASETKATPIARIPGRTSLGIEDLAPVLPPSGSFKTNHKVSGSRQSVRAHRKTDQTALDAPAAKSKALLHTEPSPMCLPSPNKRGYPSSRFCKILRITASLPSARPLDVPTVRRAPSRHPPVWAESRQELCEALPYYRAFQSGLYMSGRVAYGYLLEAFPAPRDTWEDGGRVVISHGGGQCVKIDNTSGKSACVLAADQSPDDARVDTLLQAYKHQTPLILIAGEGYEQLPWKLGCAYAVLGWYWISAMWVEAEPVARGVRPPKNRDYFHRYKVRFDWVQSQGSPWWLEDMRSSHGAGSSRHPVSSDSALVSAPDDESSPPGISSTIQSSESLRDRIKIHSLCKRVRRDPVTGLLTPPITPPKGEIILERPKGPHEIPSNLITAEAFQNHPSALAQLQDYASDSEIESLRDSSDKEHPSTAFDKQRKATGDTVLLRRNATLFMDFEPSYTSRSDVECWSDRPSEEAWLFDRSLSERSLPGSRPLRGTNRVAASEATPSVVHSSTVCPSCAQSSPRIYREGWICFFPNCPQFWLVDTPLGLLPIPPGFSLTYDPHFLCCAPSPSGLVKVPYNIVPDWGAAQTDDAGSAALMRGWVCRSCGRVNCRYRWEVWECANCKRLHSPILSNASTPISSLDPLYPSFMGDASVHPESGIAVDIQYLDGRTIMTYTLPRSLGKVYHAYQLEAVKGPDVLFERRPLKAATIKGALLAQHFAVNSGAEYKYNVATSSIPFDHSPGCVLRALHHIKSTTNRVLNKDVQFNEILSVMYREGQKMSWHDDGEVGLGPIVASLSLGSSATMSWRPKAERVQLNKPYYLGHEHKSTRTNPITVLELTLSHGDIIIMQGREMQERYSHRVIPYGFRVAATAREISQ